MNEEDLRRIISEELEKHGFDAIDTISGKTDDRGRLHLGRDYGNMDVEAVIIEADDKDE